MCGKRHYDRDEQLSEICNSSQMYHIYLELPEEQREREKHYISSSHLGLIRCLTPAGVSVIIYAQTICDESGNPIQICLPDLYQARARLGEPQLVRVPKSWMHKSMHEVQLEEAARIYLPRCPRIE